MILFLKNMRNWLVWVSWPKFFFSKWLIQLKNYEQMLLSSNLWKSAALYKRYGLDQSVTEIRSQNEHVVLYHTTYVLSSIGEQCHSWCLAIMVSKVWALNTLVNLIRVIFFKPHIEQYISCFIFHLINHISFNQMKKEKPITFGKEWTIIMASQPQVPMPAHWLYLHCRFPQ